MIPVIDTETLFADPGPRRAQVDSVIAEAASSIGFFTLRGPSELVPTGVDVRERLLQIFQLPEHEQRRLYRTFYAPDHPNIYRGWNPPEEGGRGVTAFDMGPDVASPGAQLGDASDDPLLGATPLPSEDLLPGWLPEVSNYYRSMEQLGRMVMRSVARGLGLEQTAFDDAFRNGISTLRLLRYQRGPEQHTTSGNEDGPHVQEPSRPRTGEHVDSGFVTLLCQHGVAGLEAKTLEGEWIPVPPSDGDLVVNFGGLLERWTEGRIRATPHRVESAAATRYSIPFFFEPRADLVVRPLPLPGAASFEPFTYGDHLWASMSKFPNFVGIANLRKPRGLPI